LSDPGPRQEVEETKLSKLAALQQRQRRLIAEDSRFSEAIRRQRRHARLVSYLDQIRASGRGVPIWTSAHNGATRTDAVTGAETPPINAHLIHLHIGIDAQAEPPEHVLLRKATRRLVLDAVTVIGTETGGMDTVISIDPDTDQPWRPRFDAKMLLVEERMLQAACYIVCAYRVRLRQEIREEIVTRGATPVFERLFHVIAQLLGRRL
jgi:hypothetical protein